MAKTKETAITMQSIRPVEFMVTIEGDGDLVLNKMDDPTARALTDQRKDKAKSIEKPNYWEKVITSIHWYNGKPAEFTEETLKQCLDPKLNAPCLTAFGLKNSFQDAVVRNEIDKYSTQFKAGVNIIAKGGLVPIEFAAHFVAEKLMSPKKGSPVLVNLNRFTGWSATLHISMLETVYSIEQVVNIINLAGFGIGIGSGRTSGYGRYHVTDVKQVA